MCWSKSLVMLSLLACLSPGHAGDEPFGRLATPAEVALWNIDVRPDGRGLPEASGGAIRGKYLFAEHCEACHGPGGDGGPKDRLVGGMGSLDSPHPVKSVGSYWPYATTLYDYIRRAMPYQAPGSLGDSEYYALASYILYRNGILAADALLDQNTLPAVRMPNRDGFVPEPEFRHLVNSRPAR